MKAVYLSLENRDEAFYLNDKCIVMNDAGAGDLNPVFDIACETASALNLTLISHENIPEPDEEDWAMSDVYAAFKDLELEDCGVSIDLILTSFGKPLTMPHTWQDAGGTECVSADSVREMLVEAGLSITG